jgi:tetratricopeptide (TPR) repeat protein
LSSKKNKLLESAQKNIQKGQYQRAISEYQELIRVDSGDVRHQQRLAELLTKAGRKDEAVKEYNSLAKHYIDNIHYVKAIAVYKQVQKLEPANAEICLTLASLNEKQGLAGNAAAEYTSALQIYEKNGENLKALKVLESMLALDPKNFAIRLRIAEKYFSTGNEDKSFAEFLSLAQSLKELNDESGLTHVMERTTKIFPKRKGELLAAVGDKAEEPVFVPQAVPSSPATPTRTPPQPAKTVISEPPSPARQMPVVTAKQEPAAPAKQQPAAPAKQQPVAPAKQQPAPEIQLAESQGEELFDFSEEPLIAELAEDDLIEDIIPIADLEELQEVGTEIPLGDSDWEEEIDITELEIAAQAASVPETEEYAEPMPLESFEEEIHELEEQELEEQELEEQELEEQELEEQELEEQELEEQELEEQELEEQELEEQELEEQELEEQELEEQELEEQELAGLDIDLELEIEIEPESSDLVKAEVPAPEEEPADSAMDLAKELSLFADEIDFDVMKADSADDQFSMDTFASYTKGDLDREDSESHYSLGLAYKEMSLFEDAIAEFSVASRSPERKIDCFILQALCFKESGKVAAAIKLLSQTLEEPDLTENQLVSIKYELALCHEEGGEQTVAKRLYSEIVTLRPDFSDAVVRLTRL